MNADLRTALRIQDFDFRIRELQDEISRLPKHIAEIERQLESHTRQLDKDKTALGNNLKSRKNIELDIQTHQQKISKLKDQMLQAKTNEQYRAFQNEIAFAEGEIRKGEDRILDLMGEAEVLERNVKAAESALAAEKRVVEGEKDKAKARTAEDRKELAVVQKQRSEAAASLPSGLLSLYERLRNKSRNGMAIAEVRKDLCTSCRMMLRPQFMQELRSGGQVLQCENCRSILYIEEQPVDVAGEMNA